MSAAADGMQKKTKQKKTWKKSMPAPPTLMRPFLLHSKSHVLAHFYFLFLFSVQPFARCVKNVAGKYEKSLHMFTFSFHGATRDENKRNCANMSNIVEAI